MMGADKRQGLSMPVAFIAGMMEESLYDLAVVIIFAIRAGHMPPGQATFFCPA